MVVRNLGGRPRLLNDVLEPIERKRDWTYPHR